MFEKLLQKVIKDLRRFFAGTQSAPQKSCADVPDQMLTVLLAADVQCLTVENENTDRNVWICKNSTRKIAVQSTHYSRVLHNLLCVSHAAVRASVEHVAIMKGRSRFPASALDSECVFAGVAFPPATTKTDNVSGTAERALFFMDELREG